MEKFIKISEAAYNEYKNLRRYHCMAADGFNVIRKKALNLSVLSEHYGFSDSPKNNADISILIYEGIDDLYESLLEYERDAELALSLIPKSEIDA